MFQRERKRKRKFIMSDSEIITIMVLFHHSRMIDFKSFYTINIREYHTELRQGIGKWIKFYNYERPHQSITKLLPAMEYGIVVAA